MKHTTERYTYKTKQIYIQQGQSRWQNQAIMGFGEKAAVTNSNIFSLTHTLKSFTDPIRHTDMYIEYI